MKLTAIRKGEPYSKRCDPYGCIQKPAPFDGLLIETDEGDEVVPAELVQIELDRLKERRVAKRKRGCPLPARWPDDRRFSTKR